MASVTNRANQLNPNNWRFWKSRGYSGRPSDWESLMGYGSSSTCGCCSCCCNKYFVALVVCLSFFLVFYLAAKGIGDSLTPSTNGTKVVLLGNDSIAMAGTGLDVTTAFTILTSDIVNDNNFTTETTIWNSLE